MSRSQPEENLIWIDLEMTGLDTRNDSIIEIATLVTDKHLNIIAEGPVLAITQPRAVMDAMDEWNRRTHGENGLTARVLEKGVGMREAEVETLAFLRQHVVEGKSPMCGNSICQDRRFMARLMPELERFFHYRNLDVSTIKELVRRWHPELMQGLKKNANHQAMDDIRASVAELSYYREHFIRG